MKRNKDGLYDDMLLVAPWLHFRLRHAINWSDWLERRTWNKQKLLDHMKKCDLAVLDIKVEDGKEFVKIFDHENGWLPIENQGSGFNALYGGIFEEVLSRDYEH